MGYWDKREPEPKLREEGAVTLGQLEAQCESELGEVESSFRERLKNENQRFRDMCDTEYWCCLCFTSRAQKEEFLKSLGLDPEEKYIDGKEFARAVKRPVKTPDLKFAKIGKGSRDYLDRVMKD